MFLWGLRFFVFQLLESPRYLAGIGKDTEAVAIIHQLAEYNSTSCSITVENLALAGRDSGPSGGGTHHILSQGSRFSPQHIKGLFATPKMALCSSLLIGIWGMLNVHT